MTCPAAEPASAATAHHDEIGVLGSIEQITEAHMLGIGLVVALLTLSATMLGLRLLGRAGGKRGGARLSAAKAG